MLRAAWRTAARSSTRLRPPIPAHLVRMNLATQAADPLAEALSLSPHFDHLDGHKPPQGYVPSATTSGTRFFVYDKTLRKSELDSQAYRLIRLENGLEALLVSDPTTDKAAASLCVRVGHLSDPEELQGLAHFCEHLLFMGTEKYPKENEYSEFLAANSGSSNAFTGMDETNYHFDVHPDALSGALDRFAQFFIAPLFDSSCTEREIQAVDSENKRNLQNDTWRLFQLEKSLSSKTHAYWRFGTGNLESLWTEPRKNGLDTREELLKFHKKYYSANLYKLAIVGKDSLDALADLVADTFANATNRNLPPPLFKGSPFTPDELKQNIFAKTVKDSRLLELTFPFPDQDPLYSTKPGQFLSHFIGHEGPGSILSFLKAKGWANSLSSGCSSRAAGFALFKISVELTKDGLSNYQQTAQVIFDYLKLLKSTPPQEWAFKEVSTLHEMAFRFADKAQPIHYATTLTSWMQKPYPRDLVLCAPILSSEFDKDQISGSLSYLDVENCRVLVASQQPVEGLSYDSKEKWYGTEYTIKPLTATFVEETRSKPKSEGLALPSPNEFVPENLDVIDKKEVKNPVHRPTLIKYSEAAILWHKKDDRWWLPRATADFSIKVPRIAESPSTSVKARLFTDLVEDSLNEYSYDADLAGLSYSLHAQMDHFVLSVEGYNDKLPVLHKVVLERLANFKVEPERFELIKDRLRQGLENFRLGHPYQHASFHLSHFTIAGLFEPEEQLEALLNVSASDLQEFINGLFDSTHVEALVHGNVVRKGAEELLNTTRTILGSKYTLTPEQRQSSRCLVPPQGSACFRAAVQDPAQLNSSVNILYYLGDDADPLVRTRAALLAQLAQEPSFDQLRTKEQLGYIVQSGNRSSIRFVAFHVIIQSERDTEYLDDRIEAFLVAFKKLVQEMPEEDFAKQRQSLVNRKLEDHKNMGHETASYWAHIQSKYYDFERKRRDADLIAQISKEDILAFFSEHIAADAPKRAKLAVHIRGQRLTEHTTDELVQLAQEHQVTLPEELLASFKTGPTLTKALEDLNAHLQKASIAPDSAEALRKLLQNLATPPERPGVQYVDKKWRATLPVGPAAEPVEPLVVQ